MASRRTSLFRIPLFSVRLSNGSSSDDCSSQSPRSPSPRLLSLFEIVCLAMVAFGGALLAVVALTDLYFSH